MSGFELNIMRYPGSKWRIGEWITTHFPAHGTYCEPFFGVGSVFFSKDPSQNEIVNDLCQHVVNLFRVIRTQPAELAFVVEFTPWSRDDYAEACKKLKQPPTDDPVEWARLFLTSGWLQLGSKHPVKASGFRSRAGSDQNPTSVWKKIPERILAVSSRIKNAQIENRPAVELIRRLNDSDVLIYADPPYVGHTRTKSMYANEMITLEQHTELLDALLMHTGPVVLSGYHNPLYDSLLRGWTVSETTNRAQSSENRTEVLWINPEAIKRLQDEREQLSLFQGGN